MRDKTADGDDASVRSARQIRHGRADQFVKRGGHHCERPLQLRARQIDKTASIRKARGMYDDIDRSERGARGANEFGCGARQSEVTVAGLDMGAASPTLRRNGVQPLEAGRVGPLSMQHQALVPGRQAARRQPARHRCANPGPASSND